MAPSFFKILRNPSAPHLSLPPDFVSKHMENKIPKGPIIVSASGGHTWRLKIKKIGDEHCFTNGWKNVVKDIPLIYADFLIFHLVDPSAFRMTIFSPNGCEEILPPKVDEDVASETEDDNDVEEDEDEEVDDGAEKDEGVIIIKEKENDEDAIIIDGDKNDEAEADDDEEEAKENDENVVIIEGDKNDEAVEDDDEEDEKEEAKENDENVIIEGDKNDEAEEADDEEEAKGNDDVIIEDEENDGQVNDDDEKNKAEDPLFTSIIITKTRRSMLRFPAKFAGLAKIKAKGTMAIKNLDGKEWPKCFRMEISHGTERFYTTTGWSRFVRGNHLSEGDECVFRFVESEGKLLLAKVTKKEWSVNDTFRSTNTNSPIVTPVQDKPNVLNRPKREVKKPNRYVE